MNYGDEILVKAHGTSSAGQVKKAVVSQSRIDEIAADKLRCVGKSGQLAGRRVRYIRLYDPELVSHDAGKKVGYDELP